MPKCLVHGCLSRWGRKNEEYILHSFPNDTDQGKSWLIQLGYKEPEIKSLIRNIMEIQTRGRYRICSKHFGKDCYELRGSSWTLKKGSMPTLHLSLDVLSAGNNEHDYARTFTDIDSIQDNSEVEDASISDDPGDQCSTKSQSSQSKEKCVKETWTVSSEGELVKTKIRPASITKQEKKEKKFRSKRHTRSVATCTEYFPGQRHKSTQFEKHFGCKDKKIQASRRPLHRSIAIQCNMSERPCSTQSRQAQEYTREDQKVENCNVTDEQEFQVEFHIDPDPEELDQDPGEVDQDPVVVDLSPASADLEESGWGGALSNSDTFEMPQKKKKDLSYNPEPEETDINDEIFIDPKDLDSSFLLLPKSPEPSNPVTERKFIVFESCLDELLMSSRCKGKLGCTGSIVRIKKYRVGSALAVMGFCSRGHKFHLWKSQPSIGKMPVGNLLLSAGIFCSGSNFAKVESMFEFIGIYGIRRSTYYNNQKKYLFPTINYHWQQNRQQILEQLGSTPVALSADGQFDSPGRKAKYCMYSFLEHKSKKILDFQIEKVKPEITSVSLETQAFETGLERILSSRVNVKILCTGRHVSIRKTMKAKHSDILHQYDVWRLAESLGDKIAAASKKSSTSALAPWVTPAKNHLWWSAKTCNLDPALLKEQWSSIIYHVCNNHQWENGGRYKQCHHPPLTGEQKEWLSIGSPAHTKFLEIVQNPRLLKDIEKLSHFCHTRELDMFHGTSLKYHPKGNHYLIEGMVARTQLAALDHNNNPGRLQAVLKEASSTTDDKEKLRHTFSFKKSQHHWVVESTFEKSNQKFILNIIRDTIELACGKKIS